MKKWSEKNVLKIPIAAESLKNIAIISGGGASK